MKAKTRIITFLVFCLTLTLSCPVHKSRLLQSTEKSKFVITPEQPAIINNFLEFETEFTHNSHSLKTYDSLEIKLYAVGKTEELYLGSITDATLSQKPWQHSLSRNFNAELKPDTEYTDIFIEPVLYKKHRSLRLERLAVARIQN